MDGMGGIELQLGGHDGALLPGAHQPGVGARAERQPESVEQDRLACAGLSSEHPEPGLEFELQPLDEHDILDGELPQHATMARRFGFTSVKPSAFAAAL